MTKTVCSGGSQQSSSQGVCQHVLCVPECWIGPGTTSLRNPGLTRPRSLVQPFPAFPSLLQLIPARSGPRNLALLPRGSGRVPSIQGASQRSYRVQESFSVPRDVPRWSPGPCAPSTFRNCAQNEKQYVSIDWKNSKLNIYFFYLTFKKLKSCFLHICHRKSAILDFHFVSAMFVYKLHFLSAILVLQFHSIFIILM